MRSDGCRKRRYRSNTFKHTASLIVDLPANVGILQLKTTVDKLLAGAEKFIVEVIVVIAVDGPVQLADQVDKYLATLSDVASKRLIRESGAAGIVAARMTGYAKSKSDIVIFTDCSVVGTVGWLVPLVAALMSNPMSIVVPHCDDASNPAVYAATPDRSVAMYTWPLTSRIKERLGLVPTPKGLYQSPTVRGNIFAVRRYFFDKIGGYDTRLSDAAAAHLELSFRAWLCGGSVYMVDCSHVGVRNVFEPVRVTDEKSVRMIGDLWFEDQKNILLTSSGLQVDKEESGKSTSMTRLRRFGPPTCQNISVYFQEVARVPVPSPEAVYFGQLQARTDRCAHSIHKDNRIDLTHCWPAGRLDLSSMTFELTATGRLKTGNGRCLTVQRNSYILVDSCSVTVSEQQQWRLEAAAGSGGGKLINPWSNFCAMHVTDPDNLSPDNQRQIVMAQNCTADLVLGKMREESAQQFIGWKFVNL